MNYISLLQLKPGKPGTIQQIQAGGYASKRLYEMGLYPGAKITVVKNDIGPLVLSYAGNRMALGRGLAQKIFVA